MDPTPTQQLTPAQQLIQSHLLELDAKIEKMEHRMENRIEGVKNTAAIRAEKMHRARWEKKIQSLRDEADALRAALPAKE